MPVITISRQYGSLGDEIGRDVGESLNLRLVDQDIINEVAQRLGVPPSTVTRRDERDSGLVSDLVRTMRRLYPATVTPATADSPEVDEASYLQVIRQVIWEVARNDDAIIIGRAASLILRSHPGVLNVLMIAPLDVRVERIMAAEGLDHDSALQRIKESDANRARYVRHFYRANWLDVSCYDLVVNTGHFSQLRATSLICAAVSADAAS